MYLCISCNVCIKLRMKKLSLSARIDTKCCSFVTTDTGFAIDCTTGAVTGDISVTVVLLFSTGVLITTDLTKSLIDLSRYVPLDFIAHEAESSGLLLAKCAFEEEEDEEVEEVRIWGRMDLPMSRVKSDGRPECETKRDGILSLSSADG